ncbi:MAG: class I SAM-dependent methyltransferase [Thermoplasmata archaeon]|nr:class I SAM-dependent methyltransferase [Thermoplasmata archaeon]
MVGGAKVRTPAQFVPGSPVPERRFVRQLFRGLAPRYDRFVLAYTLGQDLRWKQHLLRRLRVSEGDRALDLACGTGLLLDRLSARLPGSRVVGADLSRSMLLARRPRFPLPHLVQADAERLPFTPGSFDVVTAGYLLKYVDLDRFAREVGRLLGPGGRFGGYDFSRPQHGTSVGALYSLYLHRVLPVVGPATSRLSGEAANLFGFLATIAESSGWEVRAPAAFSRAGFAEVEVTPSLGGAVRWIWARRAAA